MVTGSTYSGEKGIKIHALVTRRPGPVEPVWPAGSVGWVTERMGVYYVLCAFYSLAAGKAAVHEDIDGNFVLIVVFYSFTDAKAAVHEDKDGEIFLISVTVMMKPAVQTWLPDYAHRGTVTHCSRQRTPSTPWDRREGSAAASRSMSP